MTMPMGKPLCEKCHTAREAACVVTHSKVSYPCSKCRAPTTRLVRPL